MNVKQPGSRPARVVQWLAALFFLGTASLVVLSGVQEGVVADLLSGELSAGEKVGRLRAFFESFGAAAPLAYVLFVTVEVVVAPLPGAMLYAPGGLIFGGFWGGLLALLGNVMGAGIACQVMRWLGRPFAQRFLENERIHEYEQRLSRSGIWVVLLLRINPFTSSDLVSYAAGLTSAPVWKVMLGTLLGMAPLCWGQAYFSEHLFQQFPSLLYPLLLAGAIYVCCVILVLRRLVLGAGENVP